MDLPSLIRDAEPDEEHTLKADPFAQLKLLDVQDLDYRLDQLRRQLEALPETSQLKALAATRRELDDQARDARIRVDDLTREQKKSDADVEQVKGRRVRDQDRMDRGLVTNPKDLERMQQELVSLNRRISELEDIELEVMEQLEEAQASLDDVAAGIERVDSESAELTVSRDARAEALTAEIAKLAAERDEAAVGMPEDLMALYLKLREQKSGVGVAVLRARQCGGCSLEVNAAELGVIAAAASDEVLRCEECNRILVRTSESGI